MNKRRRRQIFFRYWLVRPQRFNGVELDSPCRGKKAAMSAMTNKRNACCCKDRNKLTAAGVPFFAYGTIASPDLAHRSLHRPKILFLALNHQHLLPIENPALTLLKENVVEVPHFST